MVDVKLDRYARGMQGLLASDKPRVKREGSLRARHQPRLRFAITLHLFHRSKPSF